MARLHSRNHRDREPRYTVRLSSRSGPWVERRARSLGTGSVAEQIAADVATLADILAGEARRLPLTVAEAQLLRDLAGEGLVAPGTGRVLLGALIDAVDIAREAGSDLSVTYGIEEEQLMRKVRSLGPAGDLAVREAVAEWRATSLGHGRRLPQRGAEHHRKHPVEEPA